VTPAEGAVTPRIALAGLERLDAPDRPLIAVAVSGGGDSLALLHLAKAWADGAGRTLIALTVEHGLSSASGAWSGFAAERAARLGVAHRTLPWLGPKPATGLPAAARRARHALLADAARSIGARVILLGHTADDVVEAEAMRAAGTSVPSPRLWSPSPAWPQGRGLFLLRPLLGARRADLRAMLAARGETWIDDPANDDPSFARTLARRRLAAYPLVIASPTKVLRPPAALAQVRCGLGGDFAAPRRALTAPPQSERGRLIATLCLCAAGAVRPPANASVRHIERRLEDGDFTATLAGARIEARGDEVRFCREVGERARGGLASGALPVGESMFDGRFLIETCAEGYRIGALRGLAARLSAPERERLKQLPAGVRGSLPAVISAAGEVSCPVLNPRGEVKAQPLGPARLYAALGAIEDEAEAGCRIPGLGGVVARSGINSGPLN
jgi:tRNA(Ile)-lysidine synthase